MERFEDFVDPIDGTQWRIDLDFLASNWTCIWGKGCKGILDDPAEELQQGCCSVGAELFDEDEAMLVAALGATLDPARFQYVEAAATGGVFADETRTFTRVIDGACIFLNRPGFSGGAGCALHLGAIDDDEDPIDYKPGVCWQLPLRVERDGNTATMHRWGRADWGPEGETMAWCCTEGPEAYVGTDRVIDSLSGEITALVGHEVAVAIRRRVDETPPRA